MRYILIILILLTYNMETACGADDAVGPDFSSYPQTQSFAYYLSAHEAKWNLAHASLLTISAFPDSGHFAVHYRVTQTGAEQDERDVYNWAIQATHNKQLSESNLVALLAAIRGLPTVNASPPLERLVVVSFRDGDKWVMHSYDSKALPGAMRQMYGLIGERFESKSGK